VAIGYFAVRSCVQTTSTFTKVGATVARQTNVFGVYLRRAGRGLCRPARI
jgi:hypothetical protein